MIPPVFCRWLVLSMALLSALSSSGLAAPPGLDVPVAAGKYLNFNFPSQSRGYRVVDAFPYLRFRHPVRVDAVPSTNQMAVVGKEGYVWTFENAEGTTSKTTLLNITDRVQVTDNTGLVGLAFHPDWGFAGLPGRGYLYVYYYYSPAPQPVAENVQIHGYIRLSRFTLADGATTVDPASELVLIQQYDRHDWHGGGQMFFGDDGFLYLPIGDEGGDNDVYNVTQVRNKGLNGGVMRIDVNNDPTKSHAIRRQPIPGGTPPVGWPGSFSANYMVPNDNPWLHTDGSQLEEYWCLGLRSPHTMTLDRTTGRIYQGDVGQAAREEINLIAKGKNYQWAYREGDAPGPKLLPNPLTGVSTPPIHDYLRGDGVCVIVGPVYRGTQLGSSLTGKLLFADHELGTVWALPLNSATGNASGPPVVISNTGSFGYTAGFHVGISSWGTDHAGEVYMAKLSGYVDSAPEGTGQIMKLAGSGTDAVPAPSTLSATGAFSNLATLTPNAAFVPYEPIEGFWSDGATKKRWICIPNDGTPNSAAERIDTTAATWLYPTGTVVMKHFDMALNGATPTVTTKIETRFLIKASDGSWYGVTYAWRTNQSDADLVPSAGSPRTLSFTNPTRSLAWSYPSEANCFTCHNSAAGTVLGLKSYALNSTLLYPTTGRQANQLHTLTSLGLMHPGYTEAATLGVSQMANSNDYTATLERRAKSYLDANCAYCHMPGGTFSRFDLRHSTAVGSMGIINTSPSKDFSLTDQRIVAPRKFASSVLHARMNLNVGSGNLTKMPPLGRETVDTNGALTVREWINTLTQSFWPGANGINAEYFNNASLSGAPVLSRTDTSINFSWAGSPGAGVNADNFSVRWTGYLQTGATGSAWAPQIMDYQWTYASNLRVLAAFIGTGKYGQFLGSTGTYTELNGSNSIAGTYMPFTIELTHTTGAASASMRWKTGGSASFTPVPNARFFLAGNQPDFPTAANNAFTVDKGSTTALAVLGNDSSVSALVNNTVTIYQAPKLGTATVSTTTGNINYVNNASLLGSKDSIIYTVKNVATNTSNRALVDITVRTHSSLWQAQYFTPAQIATPAFSGWNADPDNDRVPNLLEYAFGTVPVNDQSYPSISSQQVTLAGGAKAVNITYPRLVGAGVDVSVQTSSILQGWAADAAATVTSTTSGGLPSYVVSFPVVPGNKKFARLLVSLRE